MSLPDVVIVGGGVIGLSVAYTLACEGVTSTILEGSEPGRAASWAGAGILSPGPEGPSKNPSAALRGLSYRLHERWARSLAEETGIDNGFRRTGGVDVAWTEEEEAEIVRAAGKWRLEGIAFERMEPRDFGRVEPMLNPELRVAYFLIDRAQIRNPRHLRALIAACERRGVRILRDQPATGFRRAGDRVEVVETSGGTVAAGQVVVSAGPWSGRLLEGLGLSIPTPPVKGQIVLLKGERPTLSRIVEHGKNYLVPRDDGRILVGATEEDAGFDVRPAPEATRDLIAEALRLCPSLSRLPVERSWAGLRPGSVDSRPYLGRAPGFENVFVATGHKRAGLQLSTGSAALIADLVLGRPPRIPLADFAPGREPATRGDEAFRS